MQIDASIPLGVKPMQIESPMNQLAKVLQVQEMQQGQQMNRLKMDEYQRGVEEQNALRSALSAPGADPYKVLLQRGKTKDALDWQKGQADVGKTTSETDAAKYKLATQRYDYMRSTMGALAQEPTLTKQMVEQAGQALVQQGILPPEMYQQAIGNMPDDPQQLRARLTQGLKAQMTPEQVFTLFAPKATKMDSGQQEFFRDTNPNSPTYGQNTGGAPVQKVATPEAVLTDQRTRSEGAANRGVSIRGQNLTDARQRESTSATMTKPFEVTAPDGVTKILVQQDKAGNIRPVEGYLPKGGAAGDPKLTEVQANATTFVSRMRDASATVDALEKDVGRLDTEAAKSAYTNWLASPKAQQYQQGRRNWVTANLRKESGAAIPDNELENEYKKWFPVIGDSKAVIAQKQQSRKVAEEAMMVQAGPGGRQVGGILERGNSPAVKGPKPGQVQDGYRFKGGDPADPKSWEKV